MRKVFHIFAVAFLFLPFVSEGGTVSPSGIASVPLVDQKWGIFVFHDSIYCSIQNPKTELLEHSGNLLFLEVFDRFGLMVYKKQFKGSKTKECKSTIWSGIDNFGRPVAKGVYFFRVAGWGGFSDSRTNFVKSLWFFDVTSTHLPPDSSEAADIEFGDVDNDGDLDIISGINATTHFAQPILLINHGSGIYKNETNPRLPELQVVTNDVDLADVDNDGDLDIYLANTGFSSLDYCDLLLINDGRGFFQDESKKRLPAEVYVTQNVEFSDIDGDGDLDLALAILGGWESLFEVHLFLNDGKGFFVDETKERIPPSLDYTIFNLSSENVDKDSDKDLIVSSLGRMIITDSLGVPLDTISGQNALLINDGQGYFTDQTEDRMPPRDDDWTTKIRAKDVNGDDRVDLYVINIGFSWEHASNRLYLNEGEGFFVYDVLKRLPHENFLWNNDAELADFDHDGDMDIFMVNVRPGEDALDNLLINEGGFFPNQSRRLPNVLDFSTSCAAGDMDGDSDFDLVIANASGVVGIGGQDRLYENVLLVKEVQDLAEAHLINDHPVMLNYPNPFNLATDIVFSLPEDQPHSAPVVIKIYNVTGQLVRTLVFGFTKEGKNHILWDGRDGQNQPVSSGIYFYRLEAGKFSLCGRMTMIK